MNFRLTITLVFAMLLLAIFYFLLPAKKAANVDSSASTPLLPTAPADLNAITLTTDGSDELKFVRDGKTWNLTYPVNAPADPFLMQSVVGSLKGVAYKQKFEPESTGYHTPEATGTAKPDRLVKFSDDAGHDYTLAFGKSTVDGIYATFNGSKTIYLVDNNILDGLDKKPDDFRNKTISTSDSTKITRLTIKTADSSATLEKTGDKWFITAPVQARANATAADEIIREMTNISANGFSRLKRADVRLDHPIATVTAYVEDSSAPPTSTAPASGPASATKPALKAITLDMGVYTDITRKDNVYAALAGSDQVFTLRTDAFNHLNRDLKDLRDPNITPAPVAQASDLTITTDGKVTVAVSKKDDKWTLTSAGPAGSSLPADTFALGDLLTKVSHLVAIKYVDNAGDLKSIGLDPPHIKMEITIPGQSQHEVILIGKPETADKVTPVMRQGEPTVYLVQTADAEALAASNLTLRDKTVDQVNADQVREIGITGPEATKGGLTLARDGMKWVVKSGATSSPADESKISMVLGDFTPLSAVKYVDESAAQGTPDVTVAVTLLEPTTPPPGTAPATAPSTTGVATRAAATAPSTAPAVMAGMMGPDLGKTVVHTLRLFKHEENKIVSWKALWDNQTQPWTFEPAASLIDHVTKENFLPPPASQPATNPATAPAIPVPGM